MSQDRHRQENFYSLSPRVRDAESRKYKAEKITEIISGYISDDLSSSLCLDIGCSSGLITTALSNLFGQMIGLEYDELALANIPQQVKNAAAFVQGDAMCLPFASQTFDMIICAQTYEHVPSDERLFAEIFRTLKPGGWVFFSGPNKLYPIEPHYFLPFLHWLPQKGADLYLKLSGKGTQYYERSRTIWGLHRLMKEFEIIDVTIPTLIRALQTENYKWSNRALLKFPLFVWRMLLPIIPNYNWLLRKPAKGSKS